MIKLAALLITVFLVGCSSVPKEDLSEIKMEAPAVGRPPVVMMAPPPMPAPTMAMRVPMREEFIDLRTGDPGPQPEEKHKAAKIATKVVGSIMAAAEAATETHQTTIETDPEGKVIKREDVIVKDSIIGQITKLVGLITGMLGLYVGAKAFKEKFYAPTRTKSKRRPGPRVI